MQPAIIIDYSTGDNWKAADAEVEGADSGSEKKETEEYILNENSHKFHKPDCSGVKDIKDKNRREYTGSREELIREGYDPCGRCNP